jgi:hypothetical protein
MRHIRYSLFLVLGIIFTQNLFAQTSSPLIIFTSKIEALLNKVSLEGDIKSYQLSFGRILRIKGSFDNGAFYYDQKVRIFKSGYKKTKTQIFIVTKGVKLKIADIIQINNKLFYVNFYETSFNKSGFPEKIYEEILLNENEYQKNIY